MKTLLGVLLCFFVYWGLARGAEPFQTAVLTEVVNDVTILKPGSGTTKAAANDRLTGQESLRTGAKSRAELKFPDQTVARIGANSLFAFKRDSREIELKQGSVLFHSESGRGGGTVRTAAATAAVTGTTIVVAATSNGGFKLLVYEGRGRVEMPGGAVRNLEAGQMSFIMPGQNGAPPVIFFDLGAAVDSSALLKGFKSPLASQQKIDQAIQEQQQELGGGKLEKTDQLVGDVDADNQVSIVDFNSLEVQFDSTDQTRKLFSADLVVSSPTLPADRGVRLTAEQFYALGIRDPSGQAVSELPASLVLIPARNILFRTPTVDLAPFAAEAIGFFAKGDVVFWGDSSFVNHAGKLGFFADGSIFIASGSNLDFNSAEVLLAAGNAMNFTAVTMKTQKEISLETAGTLKLDDVTLVGNDLHFRARGIAILGTSDLTASRSININGTSGPVDLINSSFSTGRLNVFNAGTLNVGASSIKANTVNLTATDRINLVNSSFGPGLNHLSMQAHTIYLAQVTFPAGSTISLTSGLPNGGTPNFAGVIPGRVNFGSGVFYNTQPLFDASSWNVFKTGADGSKINVN